MRTNIILDDALVEEAQALSGKLVGVALREFIENRKRLDLRDLRGVSDLRADYNYRETRT